MLDPKEAYAPEGRERIGFVLADGTIIECENLSESDCGFDFKGEDLIQYGETAKASWHTHPGLPSNLSVGDKESFLAWPDMQHMVVGSDGTRIFAVQNNRVVQISGPT